ncbi:DUF1353 domain-containing protein [Pseudomonas baltica]|uniref:DUF1353 domain-containing protein n=1 Tax=Pseudomonas baltica TaxID=2762576 RepID=UPI0028A2188F|nr:DUF1353 domain-containing protein [Pseudomonas baltica]
MSKFLNTLKTEQVGKWNHTLLGRLDLEDEIEGNISVPSGFQTNFASIGSLHNIFLFLLFALVAGYGNYAATVHDFLYTTGVMSRDRADAVFYRALRAEGIAKWRAWLFWVGVRIGGASHYRTAA